MEITDKKSELEIASYSKAPSLRESPFLDDLIIKTRGKRLTVARGSALINEATGKIESRTEIGQVIPVDTEQFIRLFSKDLADWFDFDRATQKLFAKMLIKVQSEAINRDIFYYAIEDMMTDTGYSKPTVYKCLTELINKKIIAKHHNQNLFFLNPRFLFNGDRADFVKSYRIKKSISHRDPNTVDMLSGVADSEV